MSSGVAAPMLDGMTTPHNSKNTAAFYLQAALSFGIALLSVCAGIAYLPVDPWPRAFLALGAVFLVTSSFTLAKCVRDAQESDRAFSRLDAARLERLLADYDPFNPTHIRADASPDHGCSADAAVPVRAGRSLTLRSWHRDAQ